MLAFNDGMTAVYYTNILIKSNYVKMNLCNGYKIISLIIWIVMLCTKETASASRWPSTFASTSWLDNTRGTLSFANSSVSGLTMILFGVTHNSWDCIDNSSSSLLIMKSKSTILINIGATTLTLSVYLCLELVQITSVSYYYYQRHEAQPTFGYERVYVSMSSTLTSSSEICNFTISVPTAEFHVIVKSGNVSDAKVTCPSGILGNYDYVYYPKDNSSALCNSSKDIWDGCTDKTMITFNYTSCSQKISYSAGGVLWCVANIGDTYGVVYNNDSSLVSSTDDKLATYRFSCIVGNHYSASIAPGNCTSQQTATSYPMKWNSINLANENAGVYLTLSPYVTCGPTQPLSRASTVSVGAIVGGILGALVFCVLAAFLVYYFVFARRSEVHKMPIEEVAEVTEVIDASAQAGVNQESKNANKSLSKSPRNRQSKRRTENNDNLENSAKNETEASLTIAKESDNRIKKKKKRKAKAKGKSIHTKSDKDDTKGEQDMPQMNSVEFMQNDNVKDKQQHESEKTVALDSNKDNGDLDKNEGSRKNILMINAHLKEPILIINETETNGTIINGHAKKPSLIKDKPMRNSTVLSLVGVEADAASVVPDIVSSNEKSKGTKKEKKIIEIKAVESKNKDDTGEKKSKTKKKLKRSKKEKKKKN